ncbi:MAG TPA: hypothetical protein VME66_03520 [Candidatus Acidoferrales bacterium]|nr:hypothetical protein [Candidatus Acidoferrales bacterium]
MGRDAWVMVLSGVITATLLGLAVAVALLLGPRIARGLTTNRPDDPVTRREVLAKIADVRVPEGFRIGHVTDFFPSLQANLVSNDQVHWMRITLSRENALSPTSVYMSNTWLIDLAVNWTCSNMRRLRDEQFSVRGKSVSFHQVVCAVPKGEQLHLEYGEFEGVAPQTLLLAVAPATSWQSRPVRELLASVR